MPENDKWLERWAVRSSSGHGDYIIGRDTDGKYGCSCMGWKTHIYCPKCHNALKKGMTTCPTCYRDVAEVERHDCTHIQEVKAGRGKTIGQAVLDRMLGR